MDKNDNELLKLIPFLEKLVELVSLSLLYLPSSQLAARGVGLFFQTAPRPLRSRVAETVTAGRKALLWAVMERLYRGLFT